MKEETTRGLWAIPPFPNNFSGQNRPKPNFVAQIDRKRFFWPQLTETNFFGQNRLEPNFLSKKPKTVFGQNWPELTKNIFFGQNGPKSIIPAKKDPKRVNIDQTQVFWHRLTWTISWVKIDQNQIGRPKSTQTSFFRSKLTVTSLSSQNQSNEGFQPKSTKINFSGRTRPKKLFRPQMTKTRFSGQI